MVSSIPAADDSIAMDVDRNDIDKRAIPSFFIFAEVCNTLDLDYPLKSKNNHPVALFNDKRRFLIGELLVQITQNTANTVPYARPVSNDTGATAPQIARKKPELRSFRQL